MKSFLLRLLLVTVLVNWSTSVAITQASAAETDAKSEWRGAAASVVITPDKPMWMSGYAARTKPSEGKVHDLFAKLLILEDTRGQKVVIITTDLIGITRALRDPIAARLESDFNIP
ncbi:MAG: hypothetical protein KDA74_25155, partial [Planctomycetaceae bacterium]|nr:hypothetical protein [Planctomycetaceae bacterium]